MPEGRSRQVPSGALADRERGDSPGNHTLTLRCNGALATEAQQRADVASVPSNSSNLVLVPLASTCVAFPGCPCRRSLLNLPVLCGRALSLLVWVGLLTSRTWGRSPEGEPRADH